MKPVDYAVIAFVVAVVIYVLYEWIKSKKSNKHKEQSQSKEGTFEKLLKSQKESQYIIPSRYEETSQEPPVTIVTFAKEESNKIVNEWLKKFVKDYCGKNITFTLPSPFNDEAKKIINGGMEFTILNNPNKTVEEKKDDLGMVFLFREAISKRVLYRVLINDTVQLMPELSSFLNTEDLISFSQFKDAIYNVIKNINMNNEEGKQYFIDGSKRRDQYTKSQYPTYEERSEEEIRNEYQSSYDEYKTKAQVYCQNI
jgi:hypothetical protein